MAEKAAITHRFLQRKMQEHKALRVEIETLKAEVSATLSDQKEKKA